MTDRTPTTEAGRRHLQILMDEGVPVGAIPKLARDILAIEDEARAPLVAALERLETIESAARDYVTAEREWLESGVEPGKGAVADKAAHALRAALSRENQP